MECQFCHGGFELEKICGKLHSVVNDTCNCVAHHKCMQYSSNLQQFNFLHFGGFYIEHVEKEVKRGQKLACCICKRKGATAGCSLKHCKRTYHYPCARKTSGVKTCRLVKFTSQDVDTESTEILYCIFCNSSHHNTFTEKLRLAPGDELSSNSENDAEDNAEEDAEDDAEDGALEELSKRTTDGDLFQQLFPSSSSDDNANLQSEHINQVDSLTCVGGNASLPTTTVDTNKNSVGTSSTSTANRDPLGNISMLDAAVSAMSPPLALHPDQSFVDSASWSDCRRDRLCLKSSQRKRNARQMMDCENQVAIQLEPLSNERELLDDYFNWNSSNKPNKRARIDSSPEEILCGNETKGVRTSAETVTINNECFGESGLNNSFLPNLSIPDPMEMDDQIQLKQPRNLPNIFASSSRAKSRRMSHPGQSQQVITSFLTPKKLDVAVTRTCASEVPHATKDKPKAQKQLQLSGIHSKFNDNSLQTRLINEAENVPDDFYPIPSSILPQTVTNVSPTESMDIFSITDVTVPPITDIVSTAKDAFVSSVSPGFSGCLERVSKPSKKSPNMSGIFEPAFSSKTLQQNVPSTIRKIELDGRGNFSLLTEIDSLLKPLSSDSSNDTTLDSSESGDIDCNDMDRNSRSTVSSLSYEELSTFVLRQIDDNTDIDQVYGLCIPVVEESTLDVRTSKALLNYAICSLNLVEENIFLWQITGLNENQIISIILQFSRHSRDKNELELLKMLFKSKSCDADCLLNDEISFTKENVDAVRQEIEQNFSDAEEKYGRRVGTLCNFEDLRISAAFLVLSNANDGTNAARSSLPKNHRVHVCSEDTKFVISHSLCDAQRKIISNNEYENLKWWLETFDYSTVLFYPMENALHSSDAPSVTNRLKNYFMRRTVPGGDTSFVFIHRTDPDLLIYRSFIRKMLAFVKEELVTCNHDACVVFDVGQDLRIERLADVVMPCLVGDEGTGYCFEVEVFSGTNPVFSPVSCLVVHLLLKFPEHR